MTGARVLTIFIRWKYYYYYNTYTVPVFNSYDHYCSLHRVTDTCFFFHSDFSVMKNKTLLFHGLDYRPMTWIHWETEDVCPPAPQPSPTRHVRVQCAPLSTECVEESLYFSIHVFFGLQDDRKFRIFREIPLRFRRVRLKRSVVDVFDFGCVRTQRGYNFRKNDTNRTCANQSESPKFSYV